MSKVYKGGDIVVLLNPYKPVGSDKSFTHGIITGVRTMAENLPISYNAILFNVEKSNLLIGDDNLPEIASVTAENIKAAKSKNGRKKSIGKRGRKSKKKDDGQPQVDDPSSIPTS